MNLQEAAHFLRMSKSSLYQRKDIPRYRRPGSRALLFDQDELEAWVMTGRVVLVPRSSSSNEPMMNTHMSHDVPISVPAICPEDGLDIPQAGVYHRNPRYR